MAADISWRPWRPILMLLRPWVLCKKDVFILKIQRETPVPESFLQLY